MRKVLVSKLIIFVLFIVIASILSVSHASIVLSGSIRGEFLGNVFGNDNVDLLMDSLMIQDTSFNNTNRGAGETTLLNTFQGIDNYGIRVVHESGDNVGYQGSSGGRGVFSATLEKTDANANTVPFRVSGAELSIFDSTTTKNFDKTVEIGFSINASIIATGAIPSLPGGIDELISIGTNGSDFIITDEAQFLTGTFSTVRDNILVGFDGLTPLFEETEVSASYIFDPFVGAIDVSSIAVGDPFSLFSSWSAVVDQGENGLSHTDNLTASIFDPINLFSGIGIDLTGFSVVTNPVSNPDPGDPTIPPVSVPEPATFWMLAFGLGFMGFIKRQNPLNTK